ncbi:thiamine-phosphate kinase [Corticimicrobacter populi]|uniref:Thiamine-monophosphate kinase n=1 Tax=Corticimicrobacter populi TaxID=2175229 RepID=A0A2V1K3X9_9BURK|nr:thiamine-phosphate kinase [Corticimicrobacter populi]PWF24063.1 thiamine-phosphate kinase [Corticimicrobacter populi]
MAPEFDLIRRHFTWPVTMAGTLGVGDDCALFLPPAGRQVAVSTDLLVEGRHFFPDVDPRALGHKSLAVNLSDLAAMGAQPAGCVLGLALPDIDHDWLAAFAAGFRALSERANCPLLGGDTTRSLSGRTISVTIFGYVDPAQALRRDAARPGDDLWVSGRLGAAHAALQVMLEKWSVPADAPVPDWRQALEHPEPQLALGGRLAGLAHAAIDISDGLAQDLGHILVASACGARIDCTLLPAADGLQMLDEVQRLEALLGGGDVYQLCFTAAPGQRDAILQAAVAADTQVTRIGVIEPQTGLRLIDAQGRIVADGFAGFDHFRA